MLKTYLAVMFGGAVGTGARFALSGWLAAKYGETFPVGTLVVNVSGCFVIGLFAALTGPDGLFFTSPLIRQVVMLGVLGGYTTFSALEWETLALVENGGRGLALLNLFGSVVLGYIAVWLGAAVAGKR